jgi:hypothetical protein
MIAAAAASSCKRLNVCLNVRLGILAYHNNVQLLSTGGTSESNTFKAMPFFNLYF